jgi:hypothetical protein
LLIIRDGETVMGMVRFHSCSRKVEGVSLTLVNTSETVRLTLPSDRAQDLVAPSPSPVELRDSMGGGMAVPQFSRAE